MGLIDLRAFASKLVRSLLPILKSSKMNPNVQTSALMPPLAVSKMVSWQPELFDKTVEVPYILVQEAVLNKVKKEFKTYFLKVPNFQNVRSIDQNSFPIENIQAENTDKTDMCLKLKQILLHPDIIQSFQDFTMKEQECLINDYSINPTQHFGKVNIHLNHTNYSPSAMIKGKD